MSGRVGLELTPVLIRGVVCPAWRDTPSRTFGLAWDPNDPAAAVTALRHEVAAPDAVWLAVGLGFLHVSRVDLPPAGDAAREHMVQLEPERFFATDDALRTSLTPAGDVAFGAHAAWLDGVVAALSAWAPVVRVDPAPLALAAALPVTTAGSIPLDAAPNELGFIEVRARHLVAVRRVAVGTDVGTPTPTTAATATATGGVVPAAHLVAWGALRRADTSLIGSLLGAPARRMAQRRSNRQLATAALAAVAGLWVLLVAGDQARQRTLQALEADASRRTVAVRPALDAQARLQGHQREAGLVRATLATRPNPASALAAISEVLPRDVVILSAKASGVEWQLEGTARNAAALVPLLDADIRFDNVRSLAASARFRDGNVTRESFSLSLHVRPSP